MGQCSRWSRKIPPTKISLGTDSGVFATIDGGKKWEVLGSNLPTCYVFDLAIQNTENVAVIGTHGRSAFVVDLLPVRAAAKQ